MLYQGPDGIYLGVTLTSVDEATATRLLDLTSAASSACRKATAEGRSGANPPGLGTWIITNQPLTIDMPGFRVVAARTEVRPADGAGDVGTHDRVVAAAGGLVATVQVAQGWGVAPPSGALQAASTAVAKKALSIVG